MPSQKSNCWFATWHNIDNIKNITFNPKTMYYLAYKGEIGEETKKQHYHVYVQMMWQACKSEVYKEIGMSKEDGWLAKSKASACEAARAYVLKQETGCAEPVEFGEWHKYEQGKRNDITQFVEAVKSGASEAVLYTEHTDLMLRYPNSVPRIRMAFAEPRTWKTVVDVFYGTTGSGKSHQAHNEAPEAYRMTQGNSSGYTVWWDGYIGQETVILEDFAGWLPYRYLLTLLDKYPLNVQVKGSMTPFNSKRIIITSSKMIDDWYNYEELKVNKQELMRRIDSMTLFWKTDGKYHQRKKLSIEGDL